VLDTTEAGLTGSFNATRSETGGGRLGGQYTQPTSVQSPISDSNLVFMRETVTGSGIGVTALSVIGVWA